MNIRSGITSIKSLWFTFGNVNECQDGALGISGIKIVISHWNWMESCVWYFHFWHKESCFKLRPPLTLLGIWDAYTIWSFKSKHTFLYAWWYQYLTKHFISLSGGLLYIYYTYSDIKVGSCLKALVTHLAIGHVARAHVILV